MKFALLASVVAAQQGIGGLVGSVLGDLQLPEGGLTSLLDLGNLPALLNFSAIAESGIFETVQTVDNFLSAVPLTCGDDTEFSYSAATAFPGQSLNTTWELVGDFSDPGWQGAPDETGSEGDGNEVGSTRTREYSGVPVNETLLVYYDTPFVKAQIYSTEPEEGESVEVDGFEVSSVVNALVAIENTVGETGTHLILFTAGCSEDAQQFLLVFAQFNGIALASALEQLAVGDDAGISVPGEDTATPDETTTDDLITEEEEPAAEESPVPEPEPEESPIPEDPSVPEEPTEAAGAGGPAATQ